MKVEARTSCPFLGEEKVVLCRAFPLKKPLSFEKLYFPDNYCLKGSYSQCPIYREKAKREKREQKQKICPYVELENLSYCKLFPSKKITVSGVYELQNPCTTQRHNECPLFLTLSRGGLSELKGFLMDPKANYLKGHFWLKEDNGLWKIGLSDFAQFLLGSILKLELPTKGEVIREGDVLLSMETHNGSVELLSPVEGEVVEVNHEVEQNPHIINSDPYGRGWLLKMIIGKSLKDAMGAEEAKSWLSDEIQRLQSMVSLTQEFTMADGGEPYRNWANGLYSERWKEVISEFLPLRK